MTIYDLETGHNTSRIELADYDDRELLGKLMEEQGFRKKTDEELVQHQEEVKARNKKEVEVAEKRKAADNGKRAQLEERARELVELTAGERRKEKLKIEANDIFASGGEPRVVRVIDKKPLEELPTPQREDPVEEQPKSQSDEL